MGYLDVPTTAIRSGWLLSRVGVRGTSEAMLGNCARWVLLTCLAPGLWLSRGGSYPLSAVSHVMRGGGLRRTVTTVRPTNPDLPPVALADLPRAMHYGEFYGLKPIPDEKPLLVVHGNCQAEAIRLLLQEAEDAPCVSVRVPAVHAHARRDPLAAAVVGARGRGAHAAGHRRLPRPALLGASEVQEAAPEARVVRWPVVWYAGLLPWQVVFTHPEQGDPPVVPYHDVRTVMLALGRAGADGRPGGLPAVARWSLAELRDREARAGAVPVSQFVVDAGARATNTVNHPGNPVLVSLGARDPASGWAGR